MENKYTIGTNLYINEIRYTILSAKEKEVELVDEDGEIIFVKNNELEKNATSGTKSLTSINQSQIDIAHKRLDIITPLLEINTSKQEVEKVARENDVSVATIYRWLKKYKESELLSDLAPEEKPGGKGKSRLKDVIDEIIDSNIEKYYMTNQQNSFRRVFLEIQIECNDKKLSPPHYNTIRRRILAKSEYKIIKNRLGIGAAKKRFNPKVKTFPDALYPLSSVQMDHTPLDIIIVDEEYREELGRPWLTLAIDTYSRMVLGYYIGFERPNSMSVGLCLSQAMLPKQEYLAKFDIFKEWPCHGRINCIHMDNALEFRSKMLEDACREYKIDINWRPVKVPEYGGYIERLLGTFSKEIHQLKGTTFNNISKRKNYDSSKKAVFTYKEFEAWLATYIVDVYHMKFHTGINKSPMAKWLEGVIGTDEQIGVGYHPIPVDKRKLLLDFMPSEHRTIQDYGVLLDGIHYYSDVLRKWINALDIKSGKLRAKRKFKFKRDPRDISILYFLEPDTKEYYPIPYRDSSRPPITKWELKIVRDYLTEQGRKTISEEDIFDAYKRMRTIEDNAERQTKKTRRMQVIKEKQKEHKQAVNPTPIDIAAPQKVDDDIFNDLESFKDISDGSSE